MGRITVMRFLREQWAPVSPSTHNAEGKSIILTGATAGLGLEAAKILSEKSPERLILTARNKSRISETKEGN
jgi:short-subunit dehydrogenase